VGRRRADRPAAVQGDHRVQIAGVTNTIATLAADARPIDVVATLIAELDDGYRVTTDADLVQDLPEDAIA
jgi:hypothetical protein